MDIMNIPISGSVDIPHWALTTNGHYSTKLAYEIFWKLHQFSEPLIPAIRSISKRIGGYSGEIDHGKLHYTI